MNVRKKKMRRSKLYILIFLIIIIAITGTILTYYSYNIYDVRRIDMSIIVFDHYGFSVSPESLEFGMNIPGGGGNSRSIHLMHDYKKPLMVQIIPEGEMATWVSFDNNFVLEPNVDKELTFNVNVPSGVQYGNYTGEIVIVFKKNF